MRCAECRLEVEQVSLVWEPLGFCRSCWARARQSAWKIYLAHRREGLLVPAPTCTADGDPPCQRTDVVGHHVDYRKPLDIVWLCNLHHVRAHRKAEREAGTKQTW